MPRGYPSDATVWERKFWAKVELKGPDECWPWTGYKAPSGHGLTSHHSTPTLASRKAWVLSNGPIRDGLCVNHRCDNPLCCNPAHMYLGTRADNMVDMWAKRPAASRVLSGHPFVLTEQQMEELWQDRRAGLKLRECAAKYGVHLATVVRYMSAVRRSKVARLKAVRLSREAANVI